jgi:hypothetical protein
VHRRSTQEEEQQSPSAAQAFPNIAQLERRSTQRRESGSHAPEQQSEAIAHAPSVTHSEMQANRSALSSNTHVPEQHWSPNAQVAVSGVQAD